MKAAGASMIFAVDVGAQEDTNYTNYGDHLSGFWLLWKKWNPWAQPVSISFSISAVFYSVLKLERVGSLKIWPELVRTSLLLQVRVPAMDEIQSRLAYISCEKNLEHIRRSGLCEYIRPPIDKFQTLQFNAFEEIFVSLFLSRNHEHLLLDLFNSCFFADRSPIQCLSFCKGRRRWRNRLLLSFNIWF